ncbi:hypothetical protein FA13DRAFT_1082669 [Coprinellus micaceus]|uniref:Uncharacterized protein n=1 Tax=Coprinellus micaceus TaxID=71717 RepID=A0A4Y7TRF4_COPMI|nr:hypothetical protein FA13DRAFT_1082669 [Coprinellus micaceus]
MSSSYPPWVIPQDAAEPPMSSWRFRRSSTRSLPEATSPLSGRPRGDSPDLLPRYSNLTPLEEWQATPSYSPTAPPNLEDSVEPTNRPSRFSAASWSTQSSSPSYRTNDPETRSASHSTATLTNPPRYSTVSRNSRAARDGADVRRGDCVDF